MEPTVITPLAAIADAVRGGFTVDAITTFNRRLRLLDTVDGRLAARGWRLEAEPSDDGTDEHWRLVAEDGRIRASGCVSPPVSGLVDDLPEGTLRDALLPIASIRALISSPVIRISGHQTALRDGDGKIRCRISSRTAMVEGTKQRQSAVRIEPLKGYQADADEIAERISRRFGWSPDTPDPLSTLAADLSPARDKGPGATVTDPHEPAGPALRRVLSALLETVEVRARGVIDDIDCEELHELRVAIRRSRSILALLKSPDAHPDLERAREAFAWLGQVTGPTRDLDVHILFWRAHRRLADADNVAALAPLGRFLMAEREKEHATLVSTLKSRKFRTALARWRRMLDDERAWIASDRLQQPIGDLAGRRIMKLYRRALREGAVIVADSPAEALHELRKTMKKLRYVVEIVRDAFPAKRVREVLRTLRGLQEVLGDVQDMEIQAVALRRFGKAMGDSGTAGPVTLMAIGGQAEELEIRRAAARARFAEVFAPVAGDGFARRLQSLTRTPRGKPA